MKYISKSNQPQTFNNINPTAQPLIVFMLQNPQNSCWSLKSHTKLKLTAAFLAVLLVLQYFFSASIYDVRIFDYSLTQFYIWPYTSGGPSSNLSTTLLSDETTTAIPQLSIVNITKNGSTIKLLPVDDNKTSILHQNLSKKLNKFKSKNITFVPKTPTNVQNLTTTPSPVLLEPCPLIPPVLGEYSANNIIAIN